MAVEYEIASDIAVISEVANTNQLAHVAKFYTGAVTYDDEASSKFATVTIDGKSQRVMLCIAVNGTVNYDDVPCKYSTVDGHRCLNVVEPNGTETPDDVPSVYETMVVDGKTVRAIRCVLINQTPIYDGVSSVCTFVDSGKTHTAQLVNVVGAGAIEVIVKGVPPLVLPDAVEGDLVSLKAFGGCEQVDPLDPTATPTPTAPMDIVCNNGVLKVCVNQYPTLLEQTIAGYIKTSNRTITSYAGNTLVTFDCEVGKTYRCIKGAGTQATSTVRVGFSNTVPSIGYTYPEEDFVFTRIETTWADSGLVFTANKQYATFLVRSDADTNVTTATILASLKFTEVGKEVGALYADGTVETINVHGKNLIDVADYTVPSGSGTNTLWTGSMVGTFRLSVDTSKVTSVGYPNQRFLYVVVDGRGTYVNYSSCDSIAISGTLTRIGCIGSSGYARVSGKISLQLERGTTTTPYEPYFNGGTATTEMLLKVGDYQDVQSILDGAITRNVGVKVLDGTENWILSGGTGVWANFQSITGVTFGTTSAVCTHSAYAGADVSVANMNQNEFSLFANGNIAFKNANTTSTSDWTTFLSTQYAAGTPVIVLYPLATATTESVTGQTLQVQAGDNYLEITQASLTGLELEAQYNAAVSLTIQEVEDANLDNNVTVTIQ